MITIAPEDLQMVQNILRQYIPQRTVWAFGSRVVGNAKPYSDLDLAILGDNPLSLQEHADLADAFSQSDLPWKVDLVDWHLISEEFRNIIRQKYWIIQAV
ncbi:nucleotidyltransferase domain-containing protein [Neisseria sp. ZJ106]|uniref:Nucleotidyltransferase domain-containing protein n=1 Tax=Neisseria lisongii TaxID=2912188 RepID=A0ABY7RKU5_9NEIS|nr:nucleotidyltransferase domain-containing protein [Neisseria lisongii]MCF7521574.1 nucleotidyltransferase domain-containing protein [Neisseria lisongii]WCL71823.1 nucleotidyltransferase domain-containing protein [Neisseria lisongii]